MTTIAAILRHSAPLIVMLLAFAPPAQSRDLGQWGDSPQELHDWYPRQKQPDSPRGNPGSCCGEADAYEADKQEIEYNADGTIKQVWAIITDERPDTIDLPDTSVIQRPHVPVGTRIPIPPYKIKNTPSDPYPDVNITGHGIVFLGIEQHVYCYFNPVGGV